MSGQEPVDAVVLWVDGSDPEWQKEKAKYSNKNITELSADTCRFREWGTFKYWFRAIEKNIPWIRKVHLVTCGHVPEFINTKCDKLNFVKHSDFIPIEWLPTFSSRTIEINLHRISGLAEHFIYFNDDMYIMNPMHLDDFFHKGLPCYEGLEGTLSSCKADGDTYIHSILNCISVINKHFSKYEVLKRHFSKFFNIRYGFDNFRNLFLLPWNTLSSFSNRHVPMPFLNKFFFQVWDAEPIICEKTSSHRFKDYSDINQYVFRYWGIASGDFYPRHTDGKAFTMGSDDINTMICEILSKKRKMLCINDDYNIANFEEKRLKIIDALEHVFPEKCSFEK